MEINCDKHKKHIMDIIEYVFIGILAIFVIILTYYK